MNRSALTLRLSLISLMTIILAGCSDEITDNYEDLVIIDDQEVDDGDVVAAFVVPYNGLWLAIHRDDGGAPRMSSRPIGGILVDKDDNVNVQLHLDSAVTPGERLWGVLHVDDGIVGTFEYNGVDTTDRIYPREGETEPWDDFVVQ